MDLVTTEQGLVPQQLGTFSFTPSIPDAFSITWGFLRAGRVRYYIPTEVGIGDFAKTCLSNAEPHNAIKLLCFLHL